MMDYQYPNISRTRKIIITMVSAMAFLIFYLPLSLLPTFYPSVAEGKGAKPSQYGLVFGVMSLAGFLFCPIFGHIGGRIGLKLLVVIGGIAQGISCFLFGYLIHVEDVASFVVLSYILRFIQGVGLAAATSSLTAILMLLHHNHKASIASFTETFDGLGYMIGPILGSYLYKCGGFTLPLHVTGVLILLFTCCICIIIPPGARRVKEDTKNKTLTVWEVAKEPLLLLTFIDTGVIFSSITESFWEPHLKNSEASATQYQVGMVFSFMGISYMVASFVIGAICDGMTHPTLLTLIGYVIASTAYVLIGPAPFLDGIVINSVELSYCVAIMIGISWSLVAVSSFTRASRAAMRLGYCDDMNTNLNLAALWLSSLHLGSFLGPTISGFVVEAIGFRSTAVTYMVVSLVMFLANLAELGFNVKANINNKLGYKAVGCE